MTVGALDKLVIDDTFAQTYEVPGSRSFFHLNSDGTFDDMPSTAPAVYIKDSQASILADPETVKFLRNNFGECVCIMHSKRMDYRLPVYNTHKFILGG